MSSLYLKLPPTSNPTSPSSSLSNYSPISQLKPLPMDLPMNLPALLLTTESGSLSISDKSGKV